MKETVDNYGFARLVEKTKYQCVFCKHEFKEPKQKRIYGFRAEEEYGPFGDEAEYKDVCPKCGKVVREYPVERARKIWNKLYPNDQV